MRLSNSIKQALTEGFKDNADFMRTLNTIAKQGGTWKSERQARFILDTVDGSRWEASPPAEKWAKANRMGGEYLVFADQRIQGFGRSTASKIRLTGRLYALDGGGVVSIAKVPYQHATQSSQGFKPDWDRAEIVFRRTKKPSIVIDPRGERAAAAEKNAPMIAKLKMIPNWQDQNIIVSFIGQLEAGKKLSQRQMMIVNDMLPKDQVERGNVAQWKADYQEFRNWLIKKAVPAMHRANYEYELRFEQAFKTATAGIDINDFAERMTAWSYRKPDIEGTKARNEKVAKELTQKGYVEYDPDLNKLYYHLYEKTGRGKYTDATDSDEDFHKHIQRAFKSKPTKKSMMAIDFLNRILDYIRKTPIDNIIRGAHPEFFTTPQP